MSTTKASFENAMDDYRATSSGTSSEFVYDWNNYDNHEPISGRITDIFAKYHIDTPPAALLATQLAFGDLLEQAESGEHEEFRSSVISNYLTHYARFASPASNRWLYDVLEDNVVAGGLEDEHFDRSSILLIAKPDTAKQVAKDKLGHLVEMGFPNDEDYYPQLALLSELYANVLLSGKNALKNETIREIETWLNGFREKEPQLAHVSDKLLLHLTPSKIASLPAMVKTEHARNPIMYERAKQVLPVLSGAMMLVQALSHIDAKNARPAVLESIQYLSDDEIMEKMSKAPNAPSHTIDNQLETFKPMELDWSVLPPGKLEDTAREIVEGVKKDKSGREVEIDLDRLKVLESIREEWGTDRCYYAKGVLKNRKIVRKNGQECPDEYIVLVLQEFDDQNNVIAENAVAESPIVGPHAMYIYRQDAGEGFSWRDVMAMSKDDAQLFNARKVKHTAIGRSVEEKASYLLRVPKEEFINSRHYRLQGFALPRGIAEVAYDANIDSAQ